LWGTRSRWRERGARIEGNAKEQRKAAEVYRLPKNCDPGGLHVDAVRQCGVKGEERGGERRSGKGEQQAGLEGAEKASVKEDKDRSGSSEEGKEKTEEREGMSGREKGSARNRKMRRRRR
jgi:hypothetical protein